ncbi:hypothetical protein [Streptomyces sp. MUSC 14]|uniref:hypothetical protein n=1 Tax=Streptomyces sp. MUSC 14 TaxID=1354889 RepID=UPI0015A699CC|nr:hypothetical protein [Streptomyces sp. MUSC 14]
MRVDQNQDWQTMPEPGDDRLLPLPVAPRRLDPAAKEEDQEALTCEPPSGGEGIVGLVGQLPVFGQVRAAGSRRLAAEQLQDWS